MTKKLYKMSGLLLIIFSVFSFSKDAIPRNIDVKFINIAHLTRYNEDRIAYQHIEKSFSPYMDNSLAQLLIIKDNQVYLFMDGYDNKDTVDDLIFTAALSTTLEDDFWPNKINGDPDFIQMADRRKILISSESQEFVTKTYGEFFTTVRDMFLKKQAAMFKALIVNRGNSNLLIERSPIGRKINDESPIKYKISVTALSADGVRYFAEDADGDGITETFTVSIADGFDWGFKSGPNIVNIQNNTQEYIKTIIGNFTDIAYSGSPEEQEVIRDLFPTPDKIHDMIDKIYRSNDPNVKKLEEGMGSQN